MITKATIYDKNDGHVIAVEDHDAADPTPEQTNADTLRTRAEAALQANATFLGLAAPTNAQTLAQVQRLTKECNALIRLVLGKLDDVGGT